MDHKQRMEESIAQCSSSVVKNHNYVVGFFFSFLANDGTLGIKTHWKRAERPKLPYESEFGHLHSKNKIWQKQKNHFFCETPL